MAINWKQYPPAGHEQRVKDYGRYEQLFLSGHKQAFKVKTGGAFQLTRYIISNFLAGLSTLSADMLFGEQPDFMVDDEANKAAGEAVSGIVERNDLLTMGYEAALAASFRGETVLKVRWGLRTPDYADPEAVIEEVPPGIWFPDLSEDNVRDVRTVSLAWLKIDPSDAKRQYLRIEEHEPGLIRNRLLLLSAEGEDPQEVELSTLEEYADLEPEVETGLAAIPIIHIPNYRYGSRYFGISDYQGLEALQEAINSRISMVDNVLDKHVAPKLAVPPSMFNEDGVIDRNKLELIPLEKGETIPTYITWDASLQAAFAQFDKLQELLFMLSETCPTIFGLEKFGVAQSGSALRLRMQRTISKINRKRLYFNTGLIEALWLAQQLETIHGGATYEPCPVTISWADGLPEDVKEMVEIESQRMAAGNTSVESSIRRLDGPGGVEAEMDRIAAEEGQSSVLTGRGPEPPASGAQE